MKKSKNAIVALAFVLAPVTARGLDFGLDPKGIEAACSGAFAATNKRLATLAGADAGARTFANTVREFDYILSDLETDLAAAVFLKYVSADAAVRKAAHECDTALRKFNVDIYTREDLYGALKGFAAAAGASLEGVDAKLLARTLEEFERNGLGLAPYDRARFKLLKARLVEMESAFGKNLNEVRDFLPLARAELAGMPASYVERLEQLPDGRFKVTLDNPDFFPFLENATDRAARERLARLRGERATPDNVVLLEEILATRQRLARMLGFASPAEFVLRQRMAATPETVAEFLGRMRERLTEKGTPEAAVLQAMLEKDAGKEARLSTWDIMYYHNQLKKARYAVDDELVREYFPFDKVTAAMFDLYQTLLGVRFEEIRPARAWHADVRHFEVRDAGDGRRIGEFFLDLHPRDGKYKHAAAFNLVTGRAEGNGGYRQPVSAMVANFSRGGKDRPALLKHSEVRTYFHEFGHIMHQLLTRAAYPRFAGTRVLRDFVEAPSQIFEFWIWQPEVLRKISAHYRSGEPLPEDLLGRMIEARNLDSGLFNLRQIAYASIDQAYHTRPVKDTAQTYRELYDDITLVDLPAGVHPEASFGHLMGYAASYYGYMWSKVYAADMFSVFETGGVYNPAIGQRYRRVILEPGGGREEADLVREFLGREPNERAFLRSIGLD